MDNILNEVYSLGNDINAAGNRFYNPAPRRNVFAGVMVNIGR
jgi:iron complex outermembrane receptor protein